MLFPKQPSAERNKMVKEILDELDAIHGLDDGPERTQRSRSLAEKTDVLNATTHKEEKKAVRLDIQLSHGPDELLVDATITHSLSKTNRAAEAKRTWERLMDHQWARYQSHQGQAGGRNRNRTQEEVPHVQPGPVRHQEAGTGPTPHQGAPVHARGRDYLWGAW